MRADLDENAVHPELMQTLLDTYYLIRGGCPVAADTLPRSWWIALGHMREEMELWQTTRGVLEAVGIAFSKSDDGGAVTVDAGN